MFEFECKCGRPGCNIGRSRPCNGRDLFLTRQLSDREAAEIKVAWEKQHLGRQSAHKIAILEEGLDRV